MDQHGGAGPRTAGAFGELHRSSVSQCVFANTLSSRLASATSRSVPDPGRPGHEYIMVVCRCRDAE